MLLLSKSGIKMERWGIMEGYQCNNFRSKSHFKGLEPLEGQIENQSDVQRSFKVVLLRMLKVLSRTALNVVRILH